MNSVLILIDIQNDYFEGGRFPLYNPEAAAAKARAVLKAYRQKGRPVVHVQHVNIRPEATFFLPQTEGVKIHQSVLPVPGEEVLVKHAPNGFFETGLAEKLRLLKAGHLTVCGMMTHLCVDTTVRAARDYGYSVTVPHDACATRDLTWCGQDYDALTVHDVYMAALNGWFANVISTDEYLSFGLV